MKGAIFFTSKYGSTGQYAHWISEATSLPAFDVQDTYADPEDYDFLVLGSPIYYYRLKIGDWMRKNRMVLIGKPILLFTVSGAGPGPKMDEWLLKSIPPDVLPSVDHVALRGRQTPEELTMFDRTMLLLGSLLTRDKAVSRDERQGFDYLDKYSIDPVIQRISHLQGMKAPITQTA